MTEAAAPGTPAVEDRPGAVALVLGGTRSGKTAFAETLAGRLPGPHTYLATGTATDDAMAARIATHRAGRPPAWRTAELADHGGDLEQALRSLPGTVLVDSLGTWLAGRDGFAVDAAGLCRALHARSGATVVVAEVVGLAVHAPTEAGRSFTDRLGSLTQAVATSADLVVWVAAGRAVVLDDPAVALAAGVERLTRPGAGGAPA